MHSQLVFIVSGLVLAFEEGPGGRGRASPTSKEATSQGLGRAAKL